MWLGTPCESPMPILVGRLIMKILKKGEVYLATIVENNTPRSHIVKALGARLIEIVLTGKTLSADRCTLREVQSC